MTAIKKQFLVSTAHRLIDGYVGKCNSLHGHNFLITIKLESNYLNGFGFVIDFNELKEFKNWLDNQFDHGTWLNHNDPLVRVLSNFPECKVLALPFNPTVENMAKYIFENAVAMFDGSGIIVSSITCEETPNNCAVYYAG